MFRGCHFLRFDTEGSFEFARFSLSGNIKAVGATNYLHTLREPTRYALWLNGVSSGVTFIKPAAMNNIYSIE